MSQKTRRIWLEGIACNFPLVVEVERRECRAAILEDGLRQSTVRFHQVFLGDEPLARQLRG